MSENKLDEIEREYERRINWYLWGESSRTETFSRYILIETILIIGFGILKDVPLLTYIFPIFGIILSVIWVSVYFRIMNNQKIRRALIWEIENTFGRPYRCKSEEKSNGINLVYLLTEQHVRRRRYTIDGCKYDSKSLIPKAHELIKGKKWANPWLVEMCVPFLFIALWMFILFIILLFPNLATLTAQPAS